MKTTTGIELNLGVINVPTVVGLLTIVGILWDQAGARATIDTRVEARLMILEQMVEHMKDIPNLTYRMTVSEQSLIAVNNRIDRQADQMNAIQTGISGISTKVEVLTQRIEMAIPMKKSQTPDIFLNQTPTELR